MAKRKYERPRIFRDEEIDWEELAAIGIYRDDLELDGYLSPLLRGETVGPVHLSLTMPGAEVELDAMLQIVRGDSSPEISIVGLETAGTGEIETETEPGAEIDADAHADVDLDLDTADSADSDAEAEAGIEIDVDTGIDTAGGDITDADAVETEAALGDESLYDANDSLGSFDGD
ncbi:MAG: DUF4099 domain-containing protein [Rikenellaceae bacterium]|jgi:hypothetical protein|nr:DUF4099 domain-containing protein [Rikenellaceae bacterium]